MLETTIHRLRVFKTVVECGGFSAAARQLQMTQPTISAHIKALEQELSKSLFLRAPGRTPELTEAGHLLYAYSLDIERKTSQVEQAIHRLMDTQKTISVVAQRNIANNLLPPYLASFSKAYPGVNIVFYSQTHDVVTEYVRHGKADLGLIMALGQTEGLCSDTLTEESLEIVVGPSHELSQHKVICPNELAHYPFIGGIRASTHAKMIDLYLKKLGVSNYRVTVQVEDYKSLIEMAKQGVGIAVIPRFSITDELREGMLIPLSVGVHAIHIDIAMIYPQNVRLSSESKLFRDFLQRAWTLPS
ncbi:LysR family transcriptional regulator [Alicyclobacillus suci]|uniref:LysR family transcriptional regulator n=1 Tax=Alicyclobacillus suci TaxID=2816080 RepID=UPI001662340C|nr:LysR family transcriptional regulator [Alicyclobacillus suci]